MGLFGIFKRRKKKDKTKKEIRPGTPTHNIRADFSKLKSDIENLQTQIGIIDIVLHKHDNDIAEQTFMVKKHTQKLESLEKIATSQPTERIIKPFAAINRPLRTINAAQPEANSCNIRAFSNQEQRILSVFFQNQGMALSYADIAQSLNKSPNTIKNQIRQMIMKADLFTKRVGEGNRNRFKLKEGLKIEKYLDVN